jgi:transcription antitermination factor NusG
VSRRRPPGLQPAKVPDAVIEEIRGRERNGAVELPRRLLKSGDRVRLLAGPFQGHLAIYAGMSGLERWRYCCRSSVVSSG